MSQYYQVPNIYQDCGTKLPLPDLFCPNCSAPVESTARFCAECGAKLHG